MIYNKGAVLFLFWDKIFFYILIYGEIMHTSEKSLNPPSPQNKRAKRLKRVASVEESKVGLAHNCPIPYAIFTYSGNYIAAAIGYFILGAVASGLAYNADEIADRKNSGTLTEAMTTIGVISLLVACVNTIAYLNKRCSTRTNQPSVSQAKREAVQQRDYYCKIRKSPIKGLFL